MNPLDGVDLVFKDEGPFWTVGTLTAFGRAFAERMQSVDNPRSHSDGGGRPNVASTSPERALKLISEARAAGLLVFEF
jgi:hypothetical protein